MSAASDAGPSRSSPPTPIRSLRQPTLLAIATRNDAGGLIPPARSDAVALRSAMGKKVDWRKRGERWLDKMSEETVSTDDFKRGLKYLEHHQYSELTHERHLNLLCSYPLCPNPPMEEYTSQRRISISTSRRAITEKEGNEEMGYCSKVCRLRSEFVRGQMQESAAVRGVGWTIALADEVEANGGGAEARVGSKAEEAPVQDGHDTRWSGKGRTIVEARSTSRTAVNGIPNGKRAEPARSQRVPPSKTPSTIRPPIKPALPVKPVPPSNNSQLDDVLANLIVHERPTAAGEAHPPNRPPKPIITTSSTETATTSSNSTKPTTPSVPNKAALKSSSTRAASSLIATPTKLTSSLVSASRSLGPIPQLSADTESESDVSDWEVEMDGFREDENMKGVWEMMREARDLGEG